MASGQHGALQRHLIRLFDAGTLAGLTEGGLLHRFVTRGDEVAFEALVSRHGPMVLGVCRRVLRDPHDVEDAFQATFLVLVRKAGALRDGDRLGPWLHGVACRVATRARTQAARRRARERLGVHEVPVEASSAVDWRDVRPVLDAELARLPERYRAAVVLCCLEGLGLDEVALRLGCPVETVKSRLARGRQRLRDRLIRRGLAPAAALPAILSAEAARAAVSAVLTASTIRSATRFAAGKMAAGGVSASVVALAEGVLRSMAMTKMTWGVCGLLLGAVVSGAVVLAQSGGPPQAQRATPPPRMKYELRIWKDGKPGGEPVVAEASQGAAVRIDTPHGAIEIRPVPERGDEPGEEEGIVQPQSGPRSRQSALRELYREYQEKLLARRKVLRELAESVGSDDKPTIAYAQQLALQRRADVEKELRTVRSELRRGQAELEILKAAREGAAKVALTEDELDEYLNADPTYQGFQAKALELQHRISAIEKTVRSTKDSSLRIPRRDLESTREMMADYRDRMRRIAPMRGRGEQKDKIAQLEQRLEIFKKMEKTLSDEVAILSQGGQKFNANALTLLSLQDEIQHANHAAMEVSKEIEGFRHADQAGEGSTTAPPGVSLEQRMSEVEQKLDRILQALEGSKAAKDLPAETEAAKFPRP